MSMQRTLAELTTICGQRNIELDPNTKYGRRDLVNLLAKKSRSELLNATWGLDRRMEVESPMVCFAFWHLKPNEKESIMGSKEWFAEEKRDGARMLICYHPDEGFTFFSRNISVEDYLPVDYTEKILLKFNGVFHKPSDFIGTWKKTFVIDAEVMADGNIDTTLFTAKGSQTGTELNATTAILSINTPASHNIQTNQAALKFWIFDILYFDGKWVMDQTMLERKKLVKGICGILNKYLPFEENPYVVEDKQKFFDDIVAEGGEGIVLKNWHKPYIPTESRPRTTQIKRKRTVGESGGQDIDVFISGFVPSDPKKGWKDYIGAIECSTFIKKADSTEYEHHLASVSSMPLELRKRMSIMVDGKPTINPDYLGCVITVNGQDVSAKAKRFMHATADWKRGFRTDKTKHNCVMTEEELNRHVL